MRNLCYMIIKPCWNQPLTDTYFEGLHSDVLSGMPQVIIYHSPLKIQVPFIFFYFFNFFCAIINFSNSFNLILIWINDFCYCKSFVFFVCVFDYGLILCNLHLYRKFCVLVYGSMYVSFDFGLFPSFDFACVLAFI